MFNFRAALKLLGFEKRDGSIEYAKSLLGLNAEPKKPKEGEVQCVVCGKSMPPEAVAEFDHKCADCVENEFEKKQRQFIKKIFYVLVVSLIAIVFYYTIFKLVLGDRLEEIRQIPVAGKFFRDSFLFFVIELVVFSMIVIKYFSAEKRGEKKSQLIAASVLMCVALFMMTLWLGDRGAIAYDFVLLAAILAFLTLIVSKNRIMRSRIKKYKQNSILYIFDLADTPLEGQAYKESLEKYRESVARRAQLQGEKKSAELVFSPVIYADGTGEVTDKCVYDELGSEVTPVLSTDCAVDPDFAI